MVSSFAVSVLLLILKRNGVDFSTHIALLVTIAVTTVSWILTAYVGPRTDKDVLIQFYRKVRPVGPGWKAIRAESGVVESGIVAAGDNIPLALLGWFAGCTTIWSSLFAVGNFLYGRLELAFMLLGVFVISGSALLFVVQKLWTAKESA